MQELIARLQRNGFDKREQGQVVKVGKYSKMCNMTLLSNRRNGHAFMFSETDILNFVTITAMRRDMRTHRIDSVFVNAEQVNNYCNKLNNFNGF